MKRIERTLDGSKNARAHFKNVILFTFVTGSGRITAESFESPRAEAAESTSSLASCANEAFMFTTHEMFQPFVYLTSVNNLSSVSRIVTPCFNFAVSVWSAYLHFSKFDSLFIH